VVRARCEQALGSLDGRTLALLGLTYKPGTSTLRRSLPLQVAYDLASQGARLRAYDPKADWHDARPPRALTICASAYEAAAEADGAVLLTEWPEFRSLDFGRLRDTMAGAVLFDTKDMLAAQRPDLERLGFTVLSLGRS